MSVNKVILLGRLGKDAELKYTQNGNAILNASMATIERFKDKEGKYTDKVEWHRIMLFGKRAEGLSKYLLKGVQIYLEGKITTRSWEDKNKVKHYATEIIANEIVLLGGGDKQTAHSPQKNNNHQQSTYETDDIPF
jgi:single-strand DNA-binding protein